MTNCFMCEGYNNLALLIF